MRHFVVILFCLTFWGASIRAQESMSDSFLVQRVLQEYTDTYGGLRDANKLTSLSVEGVQIQDEQEYPFLIRK